MTLTEPAPAEFVPDRSGPARVRVDRGRLVVDLDGVECVFHAHWLLDRSGDPRDVDATNHQRLFEPTDVAPDLAVTDVGAGAAGAMDVSFGTHGWRTFTLDQLRRWMGGDPEAPPAPRAWEQLTAAPTITWDEVCTDPAAMYDALHAFHEVGCLVVTGAPTVPGSLSSVAGRFGRVSPTNFGELFDVVSSPRPDDLAYTSVGLSAHLDQPYRRPTPGIQFLHTLVNDAPGGESTVVDGLAAVDALRRHDPAWFAVLCDLAVEFRYDIGTDVVVERAPMIDLDASGGLRQFRFSPRLDFPPFAEADVLDDFYAARRWLAVWLNDSEHQLEFKMEAGDVLIVDNHRVLHGRRSFDPSGGLRHLQGCYIDHDGPATLWRLLTRNSTRNGAAR